MDTTYVYNIQYWLYNVQCVYMPQSLDDYLDSWVLCCYGNTDMVSVAIVLRRSHQMLMRRIKKSCSQMASMPWPSVLSSMVCVCLSVCLSVWSLYSKWRARCVYGSFTCCFTVTVYEYMFKRSDLPDFLDEFEEQCINDEKVPVCLSVCLSVTCVCVCSRVCPRVFMYIRTFVGNVYIYLSELMQ